VTAVLEKGENEVGEEERTGARRRRGKAAVERRRASMVVSVVCGVDGGDEGTYKKEE
jgi:hypothetical protein